MNDPRGSYAASAEVPPPLPPLRGDRRCEVCVVGAGYSGLSTALHLAEAGRDVRVLEARRIAWGASGRNGGQAEVGFAPGMVATRRLLGEELARRLWRRALEARALQKNLIARFAIDCAERPGALLAAARPSHMPDLRAEAALLRDWGHDSVELIEPDAIGAHIASPRFHGGLLDRAGGHLHPLRYAFGLAAAAQAAGARIHEASPMLTFSPGAPIRIETDAGRLEADHLVLCTNAYGAGLPDRVNRFAMPVTTSIAATVPLAAETAARLIPGDVCVCDTNFVLDYFRFDAERRLLFGGRGSFTGREPADLARRMGRRIAATFPSLAGVEIEAVWSGQVSITRNRLPRFARLAPNIHLAHGFSGQGVVLTALAGKALADAILGDEAVFRDFAAIAHRPFPGGPRLRTPLLALASGWYRLRDRIG